MKLNFTPRACPLCGSENVKVFAEASIDPEKLTNSAFASRKLPEYMHCRMVECTSCRMLYASPALEQDVLGNAYKEAAFDSQSESLLAAQTYRSLLEADPQASAVRGTALDIGAGDGAFLEQLLELGYKNVVGVEPSDAPIAAAKPAIRPCLQQGLFHAEDFEPGSFDLVTCFQVMEHVWDPLGVTKEVFALLKPGGTFFIVVHDCKALSARLLGTKSPIFDIEHLQLFQRETAATLLKNGGFEHIRTKSLKNKYPIRYWIRLFPFPGKAKGMVGKVAEASRVADVLVSLPAGNLALMGQKPAASA